MNIFRRRNRNARQGFPVLKTERLVLRSFDPNDAVDVYAYAQSEKVGPMAGWAPHKCLDDSRRVVEGFIEAGDVWAVVDKTTGHVIGTVGLHKDPYRPLEGCRRLGYVLGENYWGKGYATEACREVLRYAFEVLKCPVVSVAHYPINQRSRRVIKKLGFAYEGVQRWAHDLPDGTVSDLVCYSLLKSEYEAQKTGKRTEGN